MGWISAIGGVIASAVSGFFGYKRKVSDNLTQGMGTLGEILSNSQISEAHKMSAISAIIVKELSSDSVINQNWRSCIMLLIAIIIGSFWFGHVPPNINAPMPPMLDRLFNLLEIGIMGYIPAQATQSVVRMFMTPKIVNAILDKVMKLL